MQFVFLHYNLLKAIYELDLQSTAKLHTQILIPGTQRSGPIYLTSAITVAKSNYDLNIVRASTTVDHATKASNRSD